MKIKIITSIVLLGLLTASVPAFAAEAAKADAKSEEKAEPKSKAASKKVSSKTASTKSSKADPGESNAAERAKLKVANDALKKLTSYKKGKLTRTLNSGKKEELVAFPGIGKATADAIIKARPFDSSADLILVKGVGRKTFAEIVASME